MTLSSCRVTSMIVASMPSRRVASGSRSSWVKTMTWRVFAAPRQHAREAVDAGRIHRLHGVVDHHEPERALGQRRARQEQAQRERVELALAHHAERGAADAVDLDVEPSRAASCPCPRARSARARRCSAGAAAASSRWPRPRSARSAAGGSRPRRPSATSRPPSGWRSSPRRAVPPAPAPARPKVGGQPAARHPAGGRVRPARQVGARRLRRPMLGRFARGGRRAWSGRSPAAPLQIAPRRRASRERPCRPPRLCVERSAAG